MVIAISYNKQTWNEYNDSQTADENLANGAIISADKLNHMEDGIGNNDTNKVTDNKNGTIEVNGNSITPADDSKVSTLQTQVDNSAVGTNLLTGTSNDIKSATGNDWLITTIGKLSYENSCQYTASVKIEKNDYPIFFQVWQADTNGNRQGQAPIESATITGLGRASITFNAPDKNDGEIIILQLAWSRGDVSGSYAWRQVKVEIGSVATDWCPNPDDKVNVSDMRKPASDVAGIEEVNAKQDKIGYTPADNSTVLHNVPTQVTGTDIDTLLTGGYYQVLNGTNGFPGSDNWTIYQVIPLSSANNGVQVAYETNNDILGMRSWNYTSSGLTFSNWIQFANDSKVAHLSGANNFDTVPTYGTNNKPFAINDTGATTARPTGQAVGYQYFDTTLNKPIWYNGSKWVDSTGTTV